MTLNEDDRVRFKQEVDASVNELITKSISTHFVTNYRAKRTYAHVDANCNQHWLLEQDLERSSDDSIDLLAKRFLLLVF